jgi:ketosteroid isomerase-like protein
MTVHELAGSQDIGKPAPAAVPEPLLGRRWVEGFNARDADALVDLCHPDIAYYPSVLTNQEQLTYHGHQGVRDWIAAVVAADSSFDVRTTEVSFLPSGKLLVAGEILVGDCTACPFSMVATIADGKIIEGRAYLSEPAMVARLEQTGA